MYKKYIDAGFERIEANDNVIKDKHGYGGFILTKKLNANSDIQVCFEDLNDPRLYINKGKQECHTIKMTPEQVFDLFKP